jgi:hypothetical protein
MELTFINIVRRRALFVQLRTIQKIKVSRKLLFSFIFDRFNGISGGSFDNKITDGDNPN